MIFDEFYSHYVYSTGEDESERIVSAARYIDDVDRDPVIILDGLTKIGAVPAGESAGRSRRKTSSSEISSAGSFLDGGAPNPPSTRHYYRY